MFICACVTVSTFPSNKLFHFIWGDTPSHMEVTSRLQPKNGVRKRQNDSRYEEKYLWQEKASHVYASGEYYRYTSINIKKNGQTNRNRVSGLLNDAIFKPQHQRSIVYNRNWTFSFSNFFLALYFLLFLFQREAFVLKLKIKSRCEIFKNWSVVSTIATNWNWNQF